MIQKKRMVSLVENCVVLVSCRGCTAELSGWFHVCHVEEMVGRLMGCHSVQSYGVDWRSELETGVYRDVGQTYIIIN